MVDIGTIAVTTMFFGNGDVKKIYIGDVLVYQGKTKLATPTNVSITNSTISFDEVPNATSYDVYAGDILLGEYTVSSHEAEQEGNMLTIYNVGEDNIDFENGVMTLI